MLLRTLFLSFCLLILGLQISVALPTTNPSTNQTEITSKEKAIEEIISSKSLVKNQKKEKKGFFNRIGQNFLVKKMKRMVAKSNLKTSSENTFTQEIANADEQELKDAKLIGLLLGFLLGLFGVLGVALFFKKGPRKKAAFKGAWLGVLILVALALIVAIL